MAVGPILFVVMSTEHDFSTSSQQLQALNSTLANVDRVLTPWVVFAGMCITHDERVCRPDAELQVIGRCMSTLRSPPLLPGLCSD